MPVAVIERAASPQERVLLSSLGQFASDAQRGGYASPAVIVVGDVVGLARQQAEPLSLLARCA